MPLLSCVFFRQLVYTHSVVSKRLETFVVRVGSCYRAATRFLKHTFTAVQPPKARIRKRLLKNQWCHTRKNGHIMKYDDSLSAPLKNQGIWVWQVFFKLHYPEVWRLIIRFSIKTTIWGHPIVWTHTQFDYIPIYPTSISSRSISICIYIYVYIKYIMDYIHCMSLLYQRNNTVSRHTDVR